MKKGEIYQGKDGRWRVYVYVDNERKLISAKSKEKLLLKIQSIDKAGDDTTMSGLLSDWLEYKALHVAPNSIKRIRNTWDRYYQDAGITHKPIKDITKLDIDTFIHSTIQAGMTRKEYSNFVLPLNQLLDYAVDRGIVDRNIRRDVKVARKLLQPDVKKNPEESVFTRDELEKIKKLAIDDYYNTVYTTNKTLPLAVVFMFYTGLRIGELIALKWADVDLERDAITVRRMYRHSTKEMIEDTKGAFGQREIPLVADAKSLLLQAKQAQEKARIKTEFVFSMTKNPLRYGALQKAFYKYSSRVGLKRSSHKARKTFVSMMIDAGISIDTTRRIAGHVDERTTMHNYMYDTHTDDENRQAMESALSSKKDPKNPK